MEVQIVSNSLSDIEVNTNLKTILGISVPAGFIVLVVIVLLILYIFRSKKKQQLQNVQKSEAGNQTYDTGAPPAPPPMPNRSVPTYAQSSKNQRHQEDTSEIFLDDFDDNDTYEHPTPFQTHRARPIKLYPNNDRKTSTTSRPNLILPNDRKVSTTASIHSFKPPPSRKMSEVWK